MPAATGGRKPTDIIGSALVEGWWPEDTAIASAKAFEQAFLSQIGVQQGRADEVEQARRTIRNSLQSEHDDAMHQKLTEISRQQDQIPEYARDIAETTRMMINQCEGAQRALLGIVEEYRTVIENLCRQGNYLYAAVQFWTARAEVAGEIAEAQSYIEAWGGQLISRLPAPPPAGWTPGTTAPASNGSHSSSGRVEAVNNTIKQDGGIASDTPSDRSLSGARDQTEHADNQKADKETPTSHGDEQSNPRHRAGNADQDEGDAPRTDKTDSSRHMAGTAAQPDHSSSPSSAAPTTGASPSLGSASSASSGASGMTTPAAGLTGLGRPPMDAAGGLNSAVKSPVSSLPSTAPAGGGSGAGSGGSGSGAGRLGGGGVPAVPAAPVTPVAPPASALSSSGASPATSATTPGFGSSSPVAQSAPHPSGPVGGPMGGMPAGGAMAAPVTPPPASPVGPAPTQSPGLAQGAAASPAAATSGAATNVTSTTPVAAASFSATAPERIDRYAQMAIDAVKALALTLPADSGVV